MKMKNLNGIHRVRFNDYSDYIADKCNNGGHYGFWTNYDEVENGRKISYGTTAELDFCPVCGSFGNHYVGENDREYSCGKYEVISEEELIKRIKDFDETDDCFIEFVGKE